MHAHVQERVALTHLGGEVSVYDFLVFQQRVVLGVEFYDIGDNFLHGVHRQVIFFKLPA